MSIANDNRRRTPLSEAACHRCGKVGFPTVLACQGADEVFWCSTDCAVASCGSVLITNKALAKDLIG